jgi:hypothetical protein
MTYVCRKISEDRWLYVTEDEKPCKCEVPDLIKDDGEGCVMADLVGR